MKEIESVSTYPTKLILDHMSDISLPTPAYLLDRKVLSSAKINIQTLKSSCTSAYILCRFIGRVLQQFENFNFHYDLFLTTDTEEKSRNRKNS